MSKLDDLFGKKKDTVAPVLDLSKSTVNTKEEFKRLMEKVPDYKMRPIKVRPEDIKLKEKDFSFKMPKKEVKHLVKLGGVADNFYTYMDPIPLEMRSVVIMELCAVPIDWKMLTTLRPKTKIEEDFFSKLVEIGKLQLKTEARDKRDYALNAAVRKVKNKSGVIETRIFSCNDCSEEFCNGRSCNDFNYDLYTRIQSKVTLKPKPDQQSTNAASKIIAGLSTGSGKKGGKTDGRKSIKRKIKKSKSKSDQD